MNRREDIRNFLRMQSEGCSTRTIADAVDCTTDQARDALKNMRNIGTVCKDDMGMWYLDETSVVPKAVKVFRTPPKVIEAVSAPNPPWQEVDTQPTPLSVEPQEIVELAEHLDRVSMVPAAELDKAPNWDDLDAMPEVDLKLPALPTWVARRVLDVLEQASREAKAAGRLWGTET